MTTQTARRVVTGLDEAGRSCVVFDGATAAAEGMADASVIWRTPALPADNSGRADAVDGPFGFEMMHCGGSTFAVIDYPPGMGRDGPPGWHATDTLDYIVVLAGEVVLVLEEGEVACGPGTFIVDRGVVHAWRNDGDVPTRIAVIILTAHPVGRGRTV